MQKDNNILAKKMPRHKPTRCAMFFFYDMATTQSNFAANIAILNSHSFSGFSAPVPTQLAVPVVLLKVAQSGWKNGGSNNFENSLRIVEDGCFIPPFVKVHKIRSSQNKNPKILIPDPGFKRITTAFPPQKKNTGVSWTHESIDS